MTAPAAPDRDPRQRANTLRAVVPTGGHLLALAVLLGSLVLVLAAWRQARERDVEAARLEFIAQTTQIGDLLQQRMIRNELIARGGAALFGSVARPTPKQWQGYFDGMSLRQRFPAMVGLGFSGYVRGGRLRELQVQWRQAGYGMLNVHPRGMRDAYGPILYLEPKTPANLAAVGFDMLSEPVRRQAMVAARDSGEARLSGAVHLVQDGAAKVTGMLLYLPVYKSGERPQTVAKRRAALQGWVYVPFRVKVFVQAALGKTHRDARFRIFDVTDGREDLLVTTATTTGDQAPAFDHSVVLEQYGRQWRIEFYSPPAIVAVAGLSRLDGTLALGLFTALLMYGIAWMLARTEARAHRIAVRMTEDFTRSEQRFRSAMHYSAIGEALLNGEGRITAANPSLGAIVGRTAASLVGVRFDTLFEDLSPLEPDAQAARPSDGDGVLRTTRRLHREGGGPRHAQLTYAPVPGNVGQTIHGLVQVEDVTERLQAQARVQALNRTLEARVELRTRELSQANHELEAFAYTVSHDLRAPLRAIDGFSRVLVERYGPSLDDSGRDYLGRVRNAAGRMGELIDAMLTMSRLTRGALKPERVDLSRTAAELLDELRLGDEARLVQCRVAPGLQAVGDAALLRNLMSNLLANAWKFTSGCDEALIEVGETGQGEFYVRDNGAGFDQEYVDKLFRPFQRLHTQAEFAGSGIGLASVKRIVERHGGSIRAEGRQGHGATFFFHLPGEIL